MNKGETMITGFSIKKIELRSHPENSQGVNISHELKINAPAIITQPTPFGDKTILRIDYSLNIMYLNPSMGYMIFEGTIDHYGHDNVDTSRWYDKMANDDKVNAIKNESAASIMQNIIPIAIMLSSRAGLPSVLPIPMIQFGVKPDDTNNKTEDMSYR